jgi:4-amino-4-deoxy-L-arabinose transferase-like glycosyltransferase
MRLTAGRLRDLALIGGGAFALRLAWTLVYGRASTPEGTLNDTTFYQFTSASLANGGGYIGLDGEPTAGWPPALPFAVSLLYRVFGHHQWLALALNVVLATATVVLIYLVAERMMSRSAARVAAVLFAILPGPLYMNGLFLSETMFIFELVAFLALVLFLPDRRWAPLLLGLALGVTALTRGEGLLMPIIPVAFWWGRYARGALAGRVAVMLLAMTLTVAPWTIRNAIELDAVVPVGNNASATLWSGHNPEANGWIVYPDEPIEISAGGSAETKRAAALRREAIDWALHNPLKELGLIPRRFVVLNQGSAGAIDGWLNAGTPEQWELGRSSILIFSTLADAFSFFLLFATLASLALVGLRGLWGIHPGMRAVLAYLALCLVNYCIVYYGQWRYRIPMEPFMILVATPLLVRAWERRAALADAVGRLAPDTRLSAD